MLQRFITFILVLALYATPIFSQKSTTRAHIERDSIRISLLTCTPGKLIYEHYGHTAIRIEDIGKNSDIVFNYGLFDFSSPNFIWRFTLGQTDYILGADYYKNFERSYSKRGSYIYQQSLNITQDEAHKIYAALLENAQIENRTYRYNFLYNNCSTMALYKIVESLSGRVVMSNTEAESEEYSYREILHRYNSEYRWASFGIDLLLGSNADTVIGVQERCFAPIELMKQLNSTNIVDSLGHSRPLCSAPTIINNPTVSATPTPPLITPNQAMWIFLLVTLFISLLDWYRKTISWWYDVLLISIQGVVGSVIAFMFLFSQHPTVNSNYLLIVLNPIVLFFIPRMVRYLRRGSRCNFIAVNATLIIGFATLSRFIPQQIPTAIILALLSIVLRSINNIFLTTHLKQHTSKVGIISTLLLLTTQSAEAQILRPVHNTKQPRIVIGIIADQLEGEYIERMLPLFCEGGIKTLWNSGYNRTATTFDFEDADIASATASIYTGSSPFQHGIVASHWMNRNLLNVVALADDNSYEGINTFEKSSPKNLLASNLADEIHLQHSGSSNICAIGIDREAAIFAAGHEADVVVWLNNEAEWSSSSYYGELPAWIGSVKRRNENNPTWTPLYPTGIYVQRDDNIQHKPFSYTFRRNNIQSIKSSPHANNMVTDMAIEAIKQLNMGKDNIPDILMLSYYAGNYDNDCTSLNSLEMQDIYVRLDKNIETLLEYVKREIGIENVLIFFTSNGRYNKAIPNLIESRIPHGHINMERITALLNLYLAARYGDGRYIETHYQNHIYLDMRTIERNNLSLHEVIDGSIDFLHQVSGIKSIIAQRDLVSRTLNEDNIRKRNSIHSRYSGDLIIDINPGWSIVNENGEIEYYNTTRQHFFPFILYGNGIQPQVDHTPISESRMTSTIAYLLGCSAPNSCIANPIKNLR